MIAPTAIVAPGTTFGGFAIVRDYAVIGRMPSDSGALARTAKRGGAVVVGDRVDIGNHAVIYNDVTIGDNTLIGDFAGIREGCRIGKRCIIGRAVTLNYEAIIGDDVKIIDGTHITGGMVIGNGCFIGVGVVTSNDRRVDMTIYRYHGITPPVVGERVMIGSGANILAGVRIGDNAVIGAGALVTRDVPAGGVVMSAPAELRVVPQHPFEELCDAQRLWDTTREIGA